MLASSLTYSRIEIVANTRAENIRGDRQQKADQFRSLCGFVGNGYELEWCLEEKLAEFHFKLIYDSDPDGGLPLPEETSIKSKAS